MADREALERARKAAERAAFAAWGSEPGRHYKAILGICEVYAEAYASALGASPAPEPGWTPKITASEFEEQYAARSGLTVQRLRELGRVVMPCYCEDAACEGWQSIPSRMRPISGEPAAPTPEPATHATEAQYLEALRTLGIEPPENPGEEWSIDTVDGPEPAGGTVIEACAEASARWGMAQDKAERLEAGVPPAAPTAATPRPEDDLGILAALDELVGYTLNGRGCSYQYVWDAISDWHRRAISGEPDAPTAATPEPGNDPNLMLALQASGVTPQYIERALDAIADWHRRTISGEPDVEQIANLTIQECIFVLSRFTWGHYDPIRALRSAQDDTRVRVAARLRSQHPEDTR